MMDVFARQEIEASVAYRRPLGFYMVHCALVKLALCKLVL